MAKRDRGVKPSPTDVNRRAPLNQLEERSLAPSGRRLIRLLRGNGLDGRTIEELLRPENLWMLKAVLLYHLSARSS